MKSDPLNKLLVTFAEHLPPDVMGQTISDLDEFRKETITKSKERIKDELAKSFANAHAQQAEESEKTD